MRESVAESIRRKTVVIRIEEIVVVRGIVVPES